MLDNLVSIKIVASILTSIMIKTKLSILFKNSEKLTGQMKPHEVFRFSGPFIMFGAKFISQQPFTLKTLESRYSAILSNCKQLVFILKRILLSIA
jgi:hypothetical protein